MQNVAARQACGNATRVVIHGYAADEATRRKLAPICRRSLRAGLMAIMGERCARGLLNPADRSEADFRPVDGIGVTAGLPGQAEQR
jgi:hypothetical protein